MGIAHDPTLPGLAAQFGAGLGGDCGVGVHAEFLAGLAPVAPEWQGVALEFVGGR